MTLRRTFPRFVLILLFACVALLMLERAGLVQLPRKYDPFAVPDLSETPQWLTSTQLKLVDMDSGACHTALAHTGLDANFLPEKNIGTECARTSTVQLTRLSAARIRSEETRCNMAARLYVWERHVVQPEARSLLGEGVAEILHYGSYNCRTIAGSSWMSEHAHANAFDIAGFKLRSGKVISVQKDWAGTGRASQFLHAVREGACQYFNLTLSPDYNAAHHDHFHVDMGWARGCH